MSPLLQLFYHFVSSNHYSILVLFLFIPSPSPAPFIFRNFILPLFSSCFIPHFLHFHRLLFPHFVSTPPCFSSSFVSLYAPQPLSFLIQLTSSFFILPSLSDRADSIPWCRFQSNGTYFSPSLYYIHLLLLVFLIHARIESLSVALLSSHSFSFPFLLRTHFLPVKPAFPPNYYLFYSYFLILFSFSPFFPFF